MPIALRDSICDSEDDDELGLAQGEHGHDSSEQPLQGPNSLREDAGSLKTSANNTQYVRRQQPDPTTGQSDSAVATLNDDHMTSHSAEKRHHTSGATGHTSGSPKEFAKPSNASPDHVVSERGYLGESVTNGMMSVPLEPEIAFSNTYSTVPDGSSAAQALIAEHIHKPEVISNPLPTQPSSAPWSGSDRTTPEKSSLGVTNARGILSEQERHIIDVDTTDAPPDGKQQLANNIDSDLVKDIISRLGNDGRRSSPQVVIPVSAPIHQGSKAHDQNRSRYTGPDEDIPTELYQPRPSKRRATAAVEAAIDYSVVPERAAKLRRIKSAATVKQPPRQDDIDIFDFQDSPERKKKRHSPRKAELPVKEVRSVNVHNDDDDDDDDMVKVASNLETASDLKATQDFAQESGNAQSSKLLVRDQDDHVGPEKPLSRRESDEGIRCPNPKIRRDVHEEGSRQGRTTMYEDHIRYSSSLATPTLSQQQASRLTKPLSETSKDIIPHLSNKNNSIMLDDDNEEDELSLNNGIKGKRSTAHIEQPVSKSRKRGRPLKDESRERSRTPKAVLDADEHSADTISEAVQEEVELPVPPKKRGRGRPPKVESEPGNDAEAEVKPSKKRGRPRKQSKVPGDDEAMLPDGAADVGRTEADTTLDEPLRQEDAPTTGRPASDDDKIRDGKTAENERQTPAVTPPPQPPAPHIKSTLSPPRSSSAPKHRVGLSKRSRIPPLLKLIKPPTSHRKA